MVGRRKATLINLIFQYGTLGLTLVHGLLMVPLYVRTLTLDCMATGWPQEMFCIGRRSPRRHPLYLWERISSTVGERRMDALGENVGSGLFLLGVLSTFAAVIAGALAPFVPRWFNVAGLQAQQLEWAFIAAIAAMWLRLLSWGSSPSSKVINGRWAWV